MEIKTLSETARGGRDINIVTLRTHTRARWGDSLTNARAYPHRLQAVAETAVAFVAKTIGDLARNPYERPPS